MLHYSVIRIFITDKQKGVRRVKVIIAPFEETSSIYKKSPDPDRVTVIDEKKFHFANIDLEDGEEVKIRIGSSRSGYLLIWNNRGRLELASCACAINTEYLEAEE